MYHLFGSHLHDLMLHYTDNNILYTEGILSDKIKKIQKFCLFYIDFLFIFWTIFPYFLRIFSLLFQTILNLLFKTILNLLFWNKK